MDEARLSKIEQQLEEVQELLEENNHILLSMKRNARWGFVFKAILWIIFLVVPVIVLAPLVHTLIPLLNVGTVGNGNAPGSVFGIPSAQQLQELIRTYKQATSTP